MQALNEAYHALADSIRRAEYDFSELKNFLFTKTSVPQSPPKKTSFTLDEWNIKYNSPNLFIYHPKLNGYKDNITIWNLLDNPRVSLPINFNQALRRQLRKQLIPIIPSDEYWPFDGDVEIMIKLPKDQHVRNSILDSIFETYKLPAKLIDFIKEEMELPLNPAFAF